MEALERDESLWTAEGAADCDVCGGAGYVRLSRPVGDPEFGRVQPCECRRQEQEARAAARLQRLSNLGPLSEARLTENQTAAQPALAACAFADEADDQPGWLLLTGNAGSGRTRLSAEMANRRIAANRSALYFVTADLLDRLRAAMNATSGGDFSFALLFEHVRDAPFLILDDLDCISPTDWAREKLFQLLNHRRNSGRRTVLVAETADLSAIGLQSFLTLDVERVELGGSTSEARYREFGGMTKALLVQRYNFERFRVPGAGADFEGVNTLKEALEHANRFAEKPIGWLRFSGDTGVGKTHLAAAIAGRRLLAGDSVCFAVVPSLLDALRATYNVASGESFEAAFDWLKSVDLLVLDDLGAHASTDWAGEKLYQLCSWRHLRELPTVITMNDSPDKLEPRLRSRVADSQWGPPLIVRAADYRTGRAEVPDRQAKHRSATRRSPRRG